MTRDEILSMGRKAGAFIELAQEKDLLWLERFAALVAAAEREQCAKVCEELKSPLENADRYFNNGVTRCVAVIQARSET
jgi:hypothetical protein